MEPQRHSSVCDEGRSLSIEADSSHFYVSPCFGGKLYTYKFESLQQAQELARFVLRRQLWPEIAKSMDARLRTPVRPQFVIGPTTPSGKAVNAFLSARGNMGDPGAKLVAMHTVLLQSIQGAPTAGALSSEWVRNVLATPVVSQAERELRHVALGNFLAWLAWQPIELPDKSPWATTKSPPKQFHLPVTATETVLRASPDLDTQRWLALALFAGLVPREIESLHWQYVLHAMLVPGSGSKRYRILPVSANLLAWLKKPDQGFGPVVTKAARHKARAVLSKLRIPEYALRRTCVLSWLALHGVEQTARDAGINTWSDTEYPQHLVSPAEAEAFFGLTPK